MPGQVKTEMCPLTRSCQTFEIGMPKNMQAAHNGTKFELLDRPSSSSTAESAIHQSEAAYFCENLIGCTSEVQNASHLFKYPLHVLSKSKIFQEWGSDLELGAPRVPEDLSATPAPAPEPIHSPPPKLFRKEEDPCQSSTNTFESKSPPSLLAWHHQVKRSCFLGDGENGTHSASDTRLINQKTEIVGPRTWNLLPRKKVLLDLNSTTSHCTESNAETCTEEVLYAMSEDGGVGARDYKLEMHDDFHGRIRGPVEKLMNITLEELSQYFHMPILQASKELNVGLTVLKKKCRQFGVYRWPHRKLKSLNSLIQNVQELAKTTTGRAPTTELQNTVRVLEEQRKIMAERPGMELTKRIKRLRQACFKANYKHRRQEQQLPYVEYIDERQMALSDLMPYNNLQAAIVADSSSVMRKERSPFSPNLQFQGANICTLRT